MSVNAQAGPRKQHKAAPSKNRFPRGQFSALPNLPAERFFYWGFLPVLFIFCAELLLDTMFIMLNC